MKKLFFSCILAALVLSGCVSSKTYKAAFDESEARRAEIEKLTKGLDESKKTNEKLGAGLEKSKAELERLKADLQELSSAKEKEASLLKSRLDELSNKGIMTSKEIADLKVEKEKLAATDKARADEIASLKASFSDQAKEKEYLGREVERLKIKTGELSTEKEKELANVKNTYENLVREMKKEIEKGDIKITQAVDRLSVNLVEKILFDSGRAEVKKGGLEVIKRVGDILKGVSDRQIRVEGHTDNVQIGYKIRGRYPTNWELSTARATNVVRYLQDNVGIDPKLLSAAGMAENKPVAVNDTPEGRAQNRRIEIVLLPLDVDRVLEELKK